MFPKRGGDRGDRGSWFRWTRIGEANGTSRDPRDGRAKSPCRMRFVRCLTESSRIIIPCAFSSRKWCIVIGKRLLWAGAVLTIVGGGFVASFYVLPKDPARTFLYHNPSGWSYIRGYCAGMGWARADLEEDPALILGGGSLDGTLDQETGLRTWELDCTADRGMAGVADGYNRIVRLWVYLKGPPAYSRKQWESMLFHLTEHFNSRAQSIPPERFIVDGPPIIASDGVTKVFLKVRHSDIYLITWEAGNTSRFWSPLPNKGPIEFSTSPLSPRDGVLLYFPGPLGSDLLLLRGQAGHSKKEMTVAFDMRYGFFLRYEPSRWYPYFPGDKSYSE